jgi:hypothetical protein
MQLRVTVWEGVDWITVTEHEDKWQAFVSKTTKIPVQ